MDNWFPSTLVKDTIHQIRWVADAFCLPVIVAFSGGKDSIVLLDLVRKSGVYHTAHYNLTTVDPPELVKFIREVYPSVKIIKPKKTMWQLIRSNKLPPTRVVRYCCSVLKESYGTGLVMTGVRAEESFKRSTWNQIFVMSKTKIQFKPIFRWSEQDIWKYIADNNLKYPSLYEEDGIDRIGCIGCPMVSTKQREMHFIRWPKYKGAYIRAMDRLVKSAHRKRGWTTGQEMFDWWMKQ